jgi:hypothetical protein
MTSPVIPFVLPVLRGCGSRTQGGIYWECALEPLGASLSDFIFDPPLPVPAELLARLPHQGVHPFEQGGVTHLLDRVGIKHYPNVADILEEAKRFGLSRRLPKTLPFDRLTADSRLVLVHDRGYVENFDRYPIWHCPKSIHSHLKENQPTQCCAGLWWEDLDQAPAGVRTMPSFSYKGRQRPTELLPKYIPAFVASFPASRLAIVNGHGAQDALAKADKSILRVEETEQ